MGEGQCHTWVCNNWSSSLYCSYGIDECKFALVGHGFGSLVIKNLEQEIHQLSNMAVHSALDRSLITNRSQGHSKMSCMLFVEIEIFGQISSNHVQDIFLVTSRELDSMSFLMLEQTNFVSFLKPVLSKIIDGLKSFLKKMKKLFVKTMDILYCEDKKVNIVENV